MEAEKSYRIGGKGALLILPAIILGFILVLTATSPFMAHSSAAITEQDLKDAVLGKRTFTAAQLDAMDQIGNGDGKVDVADLVAFGFPVADFVTGSSEAWEGDGTVNVVVDFASSFTGTLRYSVGGSAKPGDDYEELNGAIAVNGRSVSIPITIKDDGIMDKSDGNDDTKVRKVETIVLTLFYDSNSKYVPGSLPEHTVYLFDNDAVWDGSILYNSAAMHFQMRIFQDSNGLRGSIITDGFGIIPSNPDSDELIEIDGEALSKWPASSMAAGSTTFDAVVDEIIIPKAKTQLDKKMERTFTFHADGTKANNSVDLRSLIIGSVTEKMSFTDQPQLTRELSGNFMLLREIPVIEARQPDLEPASKIN